MPIQFGKLRRKNHQSKDGNFHVYWLRCHGGDCFNAIYRGDNPPKALKSVEYKLIGEWERHPLFGKQFVIERYERAALQSPNPEAGLVSKLSRQIGSGRAPA